MRILLLSVDFPPQRGGIQNLAAHLAGGLATAHDVSVVAPRAPGHRSWDREQRFHVARAARFPGWPLTLLSFGATALLRALRRPPAVVVCGHVVLGPVCWLLARLSATPLVVMAYAYEIRAPRMRRLAGWTLRRASVVIAISDFTRRTVLGHGVAPQRIVVIHPGAGARPGGASSVPAPAAAGERIILTVARLGELYKGHDMLIRALPLILARQPTARYVIVGDGPLGSYLKRLAASVGVADAVTFAGEVSDEALDAWYQRADVFALLSRESPSDGGAEGFGLAFIEAGAWQKPVVGGRSGGIPDAVVDGVTGLLVDPTDLGAIADAILRILGDDELASRLGAQGHFRSVEELSWPNVIAAFQRVLEDATPPALKEDVRPTRL